MWSIKTPDQRVRVFLSSTLDELAEERRAAREAIGELRLIPVFFEAGARPHPPRDLYSAYLEQSHIFVGIYWNSYGWVAPGSEISGLEDEYRLCGASRPKLIYVKRSVDRQPRLVELLGDIQRSGSVCFQQFTDAAELRQLISNDLSMMISEMVQGALDAKASPPPAPVAARVRRLDLPTVPVGVIGRDRDVEAVAALLAKPGANPVTLLGAGGTGKTTLASLVAHAIQDRFADGAVFVPLAPITDHRLVGSAIAEALGVQDSGKAPIEHTLGEYLADKSMLLVLDNFEQVAEASKVVGQLVARTGGKLRVLVTSRTSLHVRGEHIHHVSTLPLPPAERVKPADLGSYDATRLFVERALAVNPKLDLNQDNADAIVEICRRMDGLPLAIELAAARCRFFQPAALTARIGRSLDFVSKGQRDLPERQQTLRAAIDWSYNLLTDETRQFFRQLGVFKRSWTLEAVDVIVGQDRAVDIEELTERLLDVSLITPAWVSHASEPRFNMLQTVHEFAFEALLEAPEGPDTTLRYAHYFRQLVLDAASHLWGDTSEPWLDKLEYELQNIRAAFHIFGSRGLLEPAWEMIHGMTLFWVHRGGAAEGLGWLAEVGLGDDLQAPPEVPVATRASAHLWAGMIEMLFFRVEQGFAKFALAEAEFREAGDAVGLATVLNVVGCFGAQLGKPEAAEKLAEGEPLARSLSDPFPLLLYLVWSYELHLQRGDLDTVWRNIAEGERLAREFGAIYFRVSIWFTRLGMSRMHGTLDPEQLGRDALALFQECPARGVKGLKAQAAIGVVLSLLLQGKTEEARPWLVQMLDLARESGEPEWVFSAIAIAGRYHGQSGRPELAQRLLGAADGFLESTQFPVVGNAAKDYEALVSAASQHGADPKSLPTYAQGRRLSLDTAAATALLA